MIYEIEVAGSLIIDIFTTGYATKGILTIDKGLPEKCSLVDIRINHITHDVTFIFTDNEPTIQLAPVIHQKRVNSEERSALLGLLGD